MIEAENLLSRMVSFTFLHLVLISALSLPQIIPNVGQQSYQMMKVTLNIEYCLLVHVQNFSCYFLLYLWRTLCVAELIFISPDTLVNPMHLWYWLSFRLIARIEMMIFLKFPVTNAIQHKSRNNPKSYFHLLLLWRNKEMFAYT